MRFLFIFPFLITPVFSEILIDLDQSLNLAYEKNQQLLILTEMVQEAKAGKTISLSNWLPQIEGYSAGYYNGDPQIFPLNSHTTFLTNLRLSQTLFEVKSYYDVKISDLNFKKVDLLYQSLKNDITFAVRKQYYKVVLDIEKVATQQENVNLLTQLLKRMKDRLKIGEAIALNVNQSQVALASQKSKYYQSLKVLKDDLHELAYLLGYNPDEIEIETKDKWFSIDSFSFLNDLYLRAKTQDDIAYVFSKNEILTLETEVIRSNPVIKMQNMALKMMNETLKKSYGEYFPKLQLIANYGGLPNPFDFYPSTHINNQVFQYGVGLELKWNLFDGLKREGTIQKTRHQKLAAYHELENLTQKVSVGFKDSITGLQTAIAQIISSEENVSLAKLTVEQAYDQLEIGYYTIYDYQIALDQLVQVRNQLSESKFDYYLAFFELEKVLGKEIGKAIHARE